MARSPEDIRRRLEGLIATAPLRNARANALEAAVGGAVRQLFVMDAFGRPDPIGTCVILCVNERAFLITAGHVFSCAQFQALFIAGDSDFELVNGTRIFSGNPQKHLSGPGNFDVGFIEIPSERLQKWGCTKPITCNQVDCYDPIDQNSIYMITGFPIRKTNHDIAQGLVGSSMFRVSAIPQLSAYGKLQLQPETHICLAYDRKQMATLSGVQAMVKPYGMSGSAVWRYDSYFSETPDATAAKLVGVLSGGHEGHVKSFVVERIGLALELIRCEYPDLSPDIPRSRITRLRSQQ